jgi:hypothetical protein
MAVQAARSAARDTGHQPRGAAGISGAEPLAGLKPDISPKSPGTSSSRLFMLSGGGHHEEHGATFVRVGSVDCDGDWSFRLVVITRARNTTSVLSGQHDERRCARRGSGRVVRLPRHSVRCAADRQPALETAAAGGPMGADDADDDCPTSGLSAGQPGWKHDDAGL